MQSAGEGQMAVNALQVRAEMSFQTLPGRHANATPAASFWSLQQTCPIASVWPSWSALHRLASPCSSL